MDRTLFAIIVGVRFFQAWTERRMRRELAALER